MPVDRSPRDDEGVDIEPAAIIVEQRFLRVHQPVAPGEFFGCRRSGERLGLDGGKPGGTVNTSPCEEMSVDVEPAAVDVEQRLLFGDQLIALGDLHPANRLGPRSVGH